MSSTFNPQILVEKLTKLNSSQQSIETLSHWCIFHMNKAKLVVETWEKQFHSAPRDRRLPFLYLANDILQNSRRKGAEFVAEFWKVLPEVLREVNRNGDDNDKKAARRLVNIWDERKVFGSHGHILKEEFVSGPSENNNTNGKQPTTKPKQSVGSGLGKIISEIEMMHGDEVNEDALLSKCTDTTTTLEKTIKDFGDKLNSGKVNELSEELQGQHASLKQCIEQLTAVQSSRANLVSRLKDALREEESKLDHLRSLIQIAQSKSDQVTTIVQQLTNSDNMIANDPNSSIVYTTQAPLSITKPSSSSLEDDRKSAAAAVAAKLTASTSSAQMLSLALTSLVSGVAFGNNSSSGDHQPEKRPKLENDPVPYVPHVPPPQNHQSPPQIPPPEMIQTAGYTCGPMFPSEGGMSPYGPPVSPYQPYQVSESGFGTPSIVSNGSMSHQPNS